MGAMYIGGVYGDRDIMDSRFHQVIARIHKVRPPGSEGLDGSLDIVFHVPGSGDAPSFRGVRTGRFSRRNRTLQVQIAVPAELLSSTDAEIEEYALASLRDAIRLATPVFRRKRILFEEEVLLASIDSIEKALVH